MFKSGVFPKRITVELTNICNISCSFCPRHLIKMPFGYMEDDLFYKIIDEAAKHLPVTIVLFFRGESLLHDQLDAFIKYAKQKGIGPLQLASNALALTDEIGDKLIAAGLDFISFSIDTNNEVIYKQARKNGDLQTSRNNILHFVKKCEEARKNGVQTPEIQVSTVDLPEYKNGQQEFIDFWQQYADRIRVYIEHSTDGNLGSIQQALPLNSSQRQACQKVFSDMIIYWDGKVALCNHDWNNILPLGNIKEMGIAEIWNGEEYEKVRNMHRTAEFPKDIVCKKCDHWQMYYLSDGFLGKVYEKAEKRYEHA